MAGTLRVRNGPETGEAEAKTIVSFLACFGEMRWVKYVIMLTDGSTAWYGILIWSKEDTDSWAFRWMDNMCECSLACLFLFLLRRRRVICGTYSLTHYFLYYVFRHSSSVCILCMKSQASFVLSFFRSFSSYLSGRLLA